MWKLLFPAVAEAVAFPAAEAEASPAEAAFPVVAEAEVFPVPAEAEATSFNMAGTNRNIY